MNTSLQRDNQATTALLYTDLIQAGVMQALNRVTEEIDEFCESLDPERPGDRLIRDLRRRLRRLSRQLTDCGIPGIRAEGLYHSTGVVLSVPVLRELCASTGMQVSGGDDSASVVIYKGPVMSPRGVTGQASFAWNTRQLENGVLRLSDARFLPPQEGDA